MTDKNVMWTLASASEALRRVNADCLAAGYNLHLGGGCLFKGDSNHDIDVMAVPRFQIPQDRQRLLDAFQVAGWKIDSTSMLPRRLLYHLGDIHGRKIDLIVVELKEML